MSKKWFITGSSRGFGRLWAEAALERGDKVALTARNLSSLQDLVDKYGDNVLALQLDVSDKVAVDKAVNEAFAHFQGIDVVINNAGYGLFGAAEEVSPEQVKAQFEVNVYGIIWVTQAFLPLLRKQGGGHIIQISSIAGLTASQYLSIYNASKWAVEGFSEALAQEVAPFNIKVTLIEPTLYGTDWSGSSAVVTEKNPDYDFVHNALAKRFARLDAGDPAATPQVILHIADLAEPPLRVLFGKGVYKNLEDTYQARLKQWNDFEELSIKAHG